MLARLRTIVLPLALLALFGVATVFAFAGADPGGPQPKRARGMDLIHYWAAGTVLDSGDAALLYDTKRYKPVYKALYPEHPPRYPVGYPPPIYQMFAAAQPTFSYVMAAKALLFTFAVMHVVGASLLTQGLRVSPRVRAPILAAAVVLPGAISSVMSGQLGGLWVLALGLAWWLRSAGRPGVAGVVLATLWMKPTLALPIFIAFLALGDTAVLGGMLFGGVLLLGASLVAPGGVGAWTAYLHRLADPGDLLGDFWIIWRRQATVRTLLAGFGASKLHQLVLGWVGTALAVVGAVFLAWLGRRWAQSRSEIADLHAGAVLSWCLLAAPHLLEYDLGMHLVGLVGSMGWIVSGRARWPRFGAVVLGFAWLAGAFVLVNKAAHVNLTALALLVWAVWMSAELRRARAIEPAAASPA